MSSSTRPSSSSIRQAQRSSTRRSHRQAEPRGLAGSPHGSPRESRAASCSGSAPRRRRFSARSASRGSSLRGTRSSRTVEAASALCATDERETLACGAVFRSVGYRGLPLDGVPFDEGRARCRTTAVACSDERRSASRRLLRRLDQARPDRRHRDEQEGRVRDGRAPARGREAGAIGGCEASAADVDALLAERGVEVVDTDGLGGDRRGRARPRRPPGPPARQAHLLGGAARGSPGLDSLRGRRRSSSELWGAETTKAVENFPVSGEPIPAPVARWLGRIKAAAAR